MEEREGCAIKEKSKKPTDIAKEYLRKIETQRALITSKSEDLVVLRELAEKITAGMDPTASFGSSGQDKIGDAATKIVDLEAEVKRDVAELDMRIKQAWELIGHLENPKHIKVLSKLYIQLKDWNTIGEEMGCTARNAQNIHGKALIKFAELMQEYGLLAYNPDKGYSLREL